MWVFWTETDIGLLIGVGYNFLGFFIARLVGDRDHTPQPSAFSASPTERADFKIDWRLFWNFETGFLRSRRVASVPPQKRIPELMHGSLTKLRVVQLCLRPSSGINTIDRQVSAENQTLGRVCSNHFPLLGEFHSSVICRQTTCAPKSPPPVLHFPSR